MLHKLVFAKLLTNFKTGIRFRNCIALLPILEIASFLKQTLPIDAIVARSTWHWRSHSCQGSVCRMREKLINYSCFMVKMVVLVDARPKQSFFIPHHQETHSSSAFECDIISVNSPILDRRGKRSPVFVTKVRSWRVHPSTWIRLQIEIETGSQDDPQGI